MAHDTWMLFLQRRTCRACLTFARAARTVSSMGLGGYIIAGADVVHACVMKTGGGVVAGGTRAPVIIR